ncbi:hypothetical protein CHLNCDRAFT_144767 [Chlorella variabilis]|uniref:Uncharacterized protein n=1 Tax=Chlorella variabilis TaxID=554065 RepID=E1ZCZ1_CHLVA|nr:hypothetical protein CHLNCDRAFT_144767 [Chlorella variabilis]EFN56132.1 hypothetical protein CHLNCDRAFT_144767 [Chlorella variabilis]|eukprot:XP_005848234.1 hypothetical protein CHLNCDRAFT_144767 [Chlorella variabilis]
MGQLVSKKPKLEINDVDRAVLTLKSQVRKLEQQRTRIQAAIDREQQMARELVAAGRKDRALLALKKRKLQEGQAAKLDGLLLNVEEALGNIETTQSQQRIFGALKEANTAVKQMQQALPLEDVEQLMQDSADAKAYEDSLRQLLGESLNPAEEEAAAAELQQLEAQLLDEQGMEMPKAPTAVARAEAAAAAAQEQPGGAVAAAVTSPEEVLLAQLPSVPKTPVQLAEGEPVEPEKEPAMLAA